MKFLPTTHLFTIYPPFYTFWPCIPKGVYSIIYVMYNKKQSYWVVAPVVLEANLWSIPKGTDSLIIKFLPCFMPIMKFLHIIKRDFPVPFFSVNEKTMKILALTTTFSPFVWFEVKLPYDLVCPLVLLVGRSVGQSVCHKIVLSFTSNAPIGALVQEIFLFLFYLCVCLCGNMKENICSKKLWR